MTNQETIIKVLNQFHQLENIKIEIDPRKENSVGYVATLKKGTTFIPIEKEVVQEINTQTNQVAVKSPLKTYTRYKTWDFFNK